MKLKKKMLTYKIIRLVIFNLKNFFFFLKEKKNLNPDAYFKFINNKKIYYYQYNIYINLKKRKK